MPKSLEDIRILDLSRVLAGPWCSQILSDLGAQVIKVEKPVAGDDTRHWGPPELKDKEGAATDESAYFLSTNRGKRSIAIDMRTAEGSDLIRKLARQSDVLIENFRPGGLEKYGLDYDSLKKDQPELIYCSITGFGQDGPRRDQPGYDFMIQGMAGLMSVTGTEDSGPLKTGVAISDLSTGMYGAIAILAALHHRTKSGRGQWIDLALFDTQLSWLANQNMNYLVGGVEPRRRGNSHPNIVPYQDFGTQDRAIIIAVGNDAQFGRLAEILERSEWQDNPKFSTNKARMEYRDELVGLMQDILFTKPSKHWLQKLEKGGIPAGPINSIPEAFADPQAKARGLVFSLPHPLSGQVPQVANPIKMSETPPSYDLPPPLLGQHTDEILLQAGYTDEDIKHLRDEGVVE